MHHLRGCILARVPGTPEDADAARRMRLQLALCSGVHREYASFFTTSAPVGTARWNVTPSTASFVSSTPCHFDPRSRCSLQVKIALRTLMLSQYHTDLCRSPDSTYVAPTRLVCDAGGPLPDRRNGGEAAAT